MTTVIPSKGWIAIDLDGTLAHYDPLHRVSIVGKPIKAMIKQVKQWLAAGIEVRIFTARASDATLIPPIQQWLVENGLPPLEVTNRRDRDLIQVWDDRVVQIETNTGAVLTPKEHIMLNIVGWIGVELDGTLAHYDIHQEANHIGKPVEKMIKRVQQWLMVEADVRLFTARAADPQMLPVIEAWLKTHRLEKMKITCEKDFSMSQFWDDRGIHVICNRGEVTSKPGTIVAERKYP